VAGFVPTCRDGISFIIGHTLTFRLVMVRQGVGQLSLLIMTHRLAKHKRPTGRCPIITDLSRQRPSKNYAQRSVYSNLVPSKRPRSVSLSSGITDRDMNASVINGAL